jgi:hypothetical protein
MAGAASGVVPEAEFLAALHAADVVLPRPPGQNGLVAGEPVDLPVVEVRGRSAVPVFTSPAHLHALVPGAPHVEIAMRSLQAMLPEDLALVVNPYAELSRMLSHAEVAALPGAPVPEDVGPAVDPDPAVLAAVRAWAAEEPGVAAAFAAAFTPPEGGDRRLAIGLLAAPPATADALLAAAGRDLAAPPGAAFALLVVDPAAPTALERFMLEHAEPFWSRQRR